MEELKIVLNYPGVLDALGARLADLPGFVRICSRSDSATIEIISALPRKLLRNRDNQWTLTRYRENPAYPEESNVIQENVLVDDPALYLSGWLDERAANQGNVFNGGLIGFLAYDAKSPSPTDTAPANRNSATPLLQVGLYDWAILCNHQEQSCCIYFHPDCTSHRRTLIQQRLSRTELRPRAFQLKQKFSADQCRETYLHSFKRIQEYIQTGDCYQINYAQRFSSTYKGDPWAAFCHIRKAVQPPYAAYIRTEHGAVLSFSPEQFLSIQDHKVRTAPIKGTRARGKTPEEDAALKEELAQSVKDRAENLMIVDLLRNDLGLHAQTGSVQVTKLFEIQSFHNVHHLVTTIEACKKTDVTPLKVLWDAFPGGSITGAPKKRAMEIIAELEPHSRSVYCGSIFWCSHSGQLNSNIAIRTLVCEGDQIYCWGGGGIVADSDAEKEYQESVNKVAYFMETLEKEFWAPGTEE